MVNSTIWLNDLLGLQERRIIQNLDRRNDYERYIP